ncbi:MAG: rod-binding protein [Rhizobiaceae bacterium]|nr:rod-binding protein [Rhizobiaceae bacterium]
MRTPALPEIASARAETARRAGETSSTEFSVGTSSSPGEPPARAASPESFRRFEAMVLQTFIQNMLPRDGAAVYGEGMAGDMWKSMLAEKMAGVMSERGGIGIADRMLGGHYAGTAAQSAAEASAMPADPVDAAGSSTAEPKPGAIAPAVLDSMQRLLSELLTGDDPFGEAPVQPQPKRG